MQKQKRAQQQAYGSTGRVNSANGRRRRRDRIERAIATDIEEAGMVGPLPGKFKCILSCLFTFIFQ
jgi:hypothetical protein